MAVRNDFSCGGIVTDPRGRLVLIATRNLKGERVIGLPKGHPQAGETPLGAALREVTEETGLEVEPVESEPAGKIDYWFQRAGHRVHKRVDFYRMTTVQTGDARPDAEVDEVLFVEPEEALDMLSYDSERRVVRDVLWD